MSQGTALELRGRWKRGGGRARKWASTNDPGNHLCCIEQRLRRQMGVPLRHARRGVSEQSLDHVERDALVYEEAGERVTQVVQADIVTALHGDGCGSRD